MIETKKRYTTATFYVVQGSSGCLLSYDTASDLGLIILKVDAIKEQKSLSHEQSQRKVTSREFPQVVNDYKDVFKDIGKLRGVKSRLQLTNCSTSGTTSKESSIPYSEIIDKEAQRT